MPSNPQQQSLEHSLQGFSTSLHLHNDRYSRILTQGTLVGDENSSASRSPDKAGSSSPISILNLPNGPQSQSGSLLRHTQWRQVCVGLCGAFCMAFFSEGAGDAREVLGKDEEEYFVHKLRELVSG